MDDFLSFFYVIALASKGLGHLIRNTHYLAIIGFETRITLFRLMEFQFTKLVGYQGKTISQIIEKSWLILVNFVRAYNVHLINNPILKSRIDIDEQIRPPHSSSLQKSSTN